MKASLAGFLLLFVAGAAHGQPFLVAPDSGTTFLPVDEVQLAWRTVPQATSYEVTVREIGGGGYVVRDQPVADTSFALYDLTENRRYEWYVDYYVGTSFGGRSEEWSFFTRYGPPGAPALTSPADSSMIGVYFLEDSTEVTFWWIPDGVPETVESQILTDSLFAYRVQISHERTFTTDVVVDDTLSCFPIGEEATCWDDKAVTILSGFVVNEVYHWRVQQQNRAGSGEWSEAWAFFPIHAVATEPTGTPEPAAALVPNRPNPFREHTVIEYSVSRPGEVTLKVYDALGAEVATLVAGFVRGGSHRVEWDARGLASGVYFCRLTAHGTVVSQPMLLVR